MNAPASRRAIAVVLSAAALSAACSGGNGTRSVANQVDSGLANGGADGGNTGGRGGKAGTGGTAAGGAGGSSGAGGVNGSGGTIDAGSVDGSAGGSLDGGGLEGGRLDGGQSSDGGAEAAVARPCLDGSPLTLSIGGVWSGTQGGETFTVEFAGGCTVWRGTVGGTLCDFCSGTYSIIDETHASSSIHCAPVAACSVSFTHDDVGTISLSGCSLTYAYDYGSGTNSWTGDKVSNAAGDVCGSLDAGGP